MMMAVEPHCISNEFHLFNCKLSEISSAKVGRDEDGHLDYMGAWPHEPKLVICAIEAEDGLFILIWEPKEVDAK